ncbi:hypothetical protein TrispH2_001770 [Trichoplax sp. H2]|uniref:Fibrinogen C-terminal domain-containing protein n=1 Tax=Trichoplax adhaerens TaxID=10228 RepID=B3RUF6_TRIAD|nr:predicted protein [Trichoplax adhaerens]EDV25323.1 predicted protein [Trichoplax adhaerens]RDD46043.1 hypothetical protein TrispH2_001770 [Trichoplax sp. H2]|eukprot:XP_002111356.1 predicted protein [Trichoplax adhaerens]
MSKFIALVLVIATFLPNGMSSVIKHHPKSCYEVKEYLQATENGYYNLFDSLSSPYTTYCDFESEPPFVWTLIESFSLEEGQKTINRKGFVENHPVGECHLSWAAFRLSKIRMDTVFGSYGSTHYRATCNFNVVNGTGLVNRVDYMRGEFCHNTYIFKSYGAYLCRVVDYVNIRGHVCRKCTLPFYATTTYHNHIDLTYSASHCSKFAVPDAITNEDVFGQYSNSNPLFSCVANKNSTTNWWIGGAYVAEAF